MIGSFLTRGLVYVKITLSFPLIFEVMFFYHQILFICCSFNMLAEWFLAMHIQLMSATKLSKKTSQRLSNFGFGASIGMLVHCCFCCFYYCRLYK